MKISKKRLQQTILLALISIVASQSDENQGPRFFPPTPTKYRLKPTNVKPQTSKITPLQSMFYYKTDLFGASNGVGFYDNIGLPGTFLKKITLRCENFLNSIQIMQDYLGTRIDMPLHGGSAGNEFSYNFEEDEYIKKIDIWYGANYINNMEFETNKGTKFVNNCAGKDENHMIVFIEGKLVSIFGLATGDYVSSIGFISTP